MQRRKSVIFIWRDLGTRVWVKSSHYLLPVGHGGWSLLLGHLWSEVESTQYQGVVTLCSMLKQAFVTRIKLNQVFKAFSESQSRDQGDLQSPKTNVSRMRGCNLTFESPKSSNQESRKGTIKHTLCRSKILIAGAKYR